MELVTVGHETSCCAQAQLMPRRSLSHLSCSSRRLMIRLAFHRATYLVAYFSAISATASALCAGRLRKTAWWL